MTRRDPGSSSVSSDRHTAPPSKKRKTILLPVLALLCSVVLLVIAWRIATRPPLGTGARFTPPEVTQPTLTEEQIQAFFDAEVRPQLEQYSQRNQEAVGSAADRITSRIGAYRKGIPAFVEDITSWGTRFGVIGRGAQDLWEKWWGDQAKAIRVRDNVSAKFAKHLFSDKDLAALVEATLKQFRDDLQASQNRLHANINSAWKSKTYAQGDLDFKRIVAQVDQNVTVVSHKMVTDSVTIGILAFVGGFALEEATEALAKSIIARVATYLATSAATTAAASGGATGTSAAAGGAGGAALGPVGTVIGVAAGIVVGLVTDWWMTKKFAQKLTGECEQLLSQVRDQILVGSTESPGLKQAFIDAIATLQQAEASALRAGLTEMAP